VDPCGFALPRHARALGTSVKVEGAAAAGDAISNRSRADAGDGDESLSWARGDAAASRHDGRGVLHSLPGGSLD
jgi:hypothetical protein